MPYDNAYNRGVSSVYNRLNDRFATLFAYSPVDDMGLYGGSTAGVLFQMGNASKRDAEDNIVNDDLSLPPVYYYGNDAEGMEGGNGFAEGTFRDVGFGHSEGVSGVYAKKGAGLFGDIAEGFSDFGEDIGKATNYIFGSGVNHHKNARLLGRVLGHVMKGKGMSGGSWYDSLKEGISDVVGLVPHLLLHGLGQEVPEVVGGVGGAILGNPDPYPVQGNSERIAGRGKMTETEKKALQSVLEKHTCPSEKRGRGRPKGSGKKEFIGNDGALLAMPAPVALSNGVPPRAQLRGAYGGGHSSAEMKVMKAVAKKLKGKGMSGGMKNLSGMTDRTIGGMKACGVSGGMKGCGDGRSVRAEIVKKVMRDRGVKMIEASKIVKAEGLYKK